MHNFNKFSTKVLCLSHSRISRHSTEPVWYLGIVLEVCRKQYAIVLNLVRYYSIAPVEFQKEKDTLKSFCILRVFLAFHIFKGGVLWVIANRGCVKKFFHFLVIHWAFSLHKTVTEIKKPKQLFLFDSFHFFWQNIVVLVNTPLFWLLIPLVNVYIYEGLLNMEK